MAKETYGIPDSLLHDPAFAPFLEDEYVEMNANDLTQSRTSKNEVEASATFPQGTLKHYLDKYEAVREQLNNPDFDEEYDRLYGIMSRIYKKDNNKSFIPYVEDEYTQECVLKQLLLMLAGDKSFNAVILGGNINEYTYYLMPKNKVYAIFSDIQKVDWPGGENKRRELLGRHYMILIKEARKVVKKFIVVDY